MSGYSGFPSMMFALYILVAAGFAYGIYTIFSNEKFTIAKEIGMPVKMQASGFHSESPILGSEPQPLTLKPYEEMVVDNTISQYKTNEKGSHCCPSPITSDQGCVCLSNKDITDLSSRGGNRLM